MTQINQTLAVFELNGQLQQCRTLFNSDIGRGKEGADRG